MQNTNTSHRQAARIHLDEVLSFNVYCHDTGNFLFFVDSDKKDAVKTLEDRAQALGYECPQVQPRQGRRVVCL